MFQSLGNKLFIALSVLVLSACTTPTLTPQDCALGAWYAVGHDDGLQGKSSDLLARHKKSCAKYDVEISSAEYRQGYVVGNKTFCDTYDHYGSGVLGEAQVTVCPSEPYASQYSAGIELYCKNFDHFEQGRNGEKFNDRCPKYPYQQDYERGVALYCKSNNPYELGRENHRYEGVCSYNFDRAYALGEKSIQLEYRIGKTRRYIEDKIRSLINEEDPDKTALIREDIQFTEAKLKEQRKELIQLKITVRDLGYLRSDDIVDDLINLL